ncbi:CRISPR-associated protein Cmr1 [Candidatus Kryptonium thompsonii]|jgi:CRISPR-associated protein Cmr1|uniref:CRISPR-associated protein Cmr1 n=1 Tax=Candidatus Kryptonium thompsonii TaxID=1633631 RepID=A0ABP2B0A5_9BACT|nr:type III-B CRISPR module RAMP protein Cmr1 [Candidatus Kryptonium thompsoni]CUS91253.1 CRISPR-associated protein Cmr1 [Candidatus Kryptonium thompsoni]CUS91727.1 CRISPR-associated protein Cmr1 [Candidatus Kryptonium thompsoni]CUS92599.1 CRISPR-associated protein Cmr1 [Candidatus Kryptonium thompsoni]CUS92706.1 CRISPR-associated protein Cmr1 [Candidatus Kryptonium thompsoni]CUS94206.1 CRISPR-associated protein Cmr1 [Candidatus Kryptonium thompsoni]
MELKLKCKTITPMFMAGADGKTPELRSSEFKGMMRWWWRAIKADDDIGKLRKEEAEIFGGTGEGEGKSKVRVIVKPGSIDIGNDVREVINDDPGLKYLYYSTFSLRARGEPIIRKYYKPESSFSLEIVSFDYYSFGKASAALWASIYLGGFGTRARRGGGNLAVESAEPNNIKGIEFYCNATSVDELEIWLKENLKIVIQLCNANVGSLQYTTLKNGKILLFKPLRSWRDALNVIGERFKNFRNNKEEEIFETPAFGMPVMHNRFSTRLVPYENRHERLSDRWASPVIFKVIKGKGENYFPVVIFLNPGGVNLIGREERVGNDWDNAKEIQKITFKILSSFRDYLKPTKELTL